MTTAWTIVGTGAHARKAYQTAMCCGISIAAFADENASAHSPVRGVTLLSMQTLRTSQHPGPAFVAIGRGEVRERLMTELLALGWSLPSLVHPQAYVAGDARVEAGVLVAAGAIIETASVIGRGAIVDIGALVDHDCVVEPFSHLHPGQVCLPGTRWPA